jgi:uncharacterized peroxidase-related enzyme
VAFGDGVTQAVLADWRTAPVGERLRAMLGFLEKLTLAPDTVGPDDVAALHAVGVGEAGVVDAIYVCAIFNMIDRVADALGFDVPSDFSRGTAGQQQHGYKM